MLTKKVRHLLHLSLLSYNKMVTQVYSFEKKNWATILVTNRARDELTNLNWNRNKRTNGK